MKIEYDTHRLFAVRETMFRYFQSLILDEEFNVVHSRLCE